MPTTEKIISNENNVLIIGLEKTIFHSFEKPYLIPYNSSYAKQIIEELSKLGSFCCVIISSHFENEQDIEKFNNQHSKTLKTSLKIDADELINYQDIQKIMEISSIGFDEAIVKFIETNYLPYLDNKTIVVYSEDIEEEAEWDYKEINNNITLINTPKAGVDYFSIPGLD